MVPAMATRRIKRVLSNRAIKTFFNLIGIVASILLIAFLFYVYVLPHDIAPEVAPKPAEKQGAITFETEELVFDGSHTLDLMEGVYVDDGYGNDITSEAGAIITAEGTLNRKIVNYICVDANGHTLTEKRVLIFENYTGPSLDVPRLLTLEAENLDNLIEYLQFEDALVAYDGFGKNITSQVTHQREMISPENYKITFRVVNEYGDEKTASVNAKISGDVKDPDFELYSDKVSVSKDAAFEPMKYVISQTSNVGNITTESSVNTSVPGEYRVVYTAYSIDRTAKISKIMNVTVKD